MLPGKTTRVLSRCCDPVRFALQGKPARTSCSNAARNPVLANVPCRLTARGGCAEVSQWEIFSTKNNDYVK